jgi:hypothetical protein
MRAQYLLRFDDLCPTMDRCRWMRYWPLIVRFGLRPILAVVPENRDPELDKVLPDARFWREMLALQATGATIGLHGYQHLCTAAGRGVIGVHERSEFAGVSLEEQRRRIAAGLAILRSKGLRPQVWVAPRHGFDATTIVVLREEGVGVISDGFASAPYREDGLIWIPQQLWGPVEKKSGVWTICVHANTASDEEVADLESFLCRFGDRFTSVDRVVAEWPIGERSVGDRCMHGLTMLRVRTKRLRPVLRFERGR